MLRGKVAVITGASSGIGAAITRRFAAEGARVVAGSIEPPAKGAPAEPGVTHVLMDVTKEAEVEALVALALRDHGCLDVMVNNAGISGVAGSVCDTPAEGLAATQHVLFNGVVYGIKHAAKAMTGPGAIINMASVTGLATYINAAHIYSAMKAAVIQLTRTAALELGPRGIRVNCICPGYIATPIFGKALGLGETDLVRSVEAVKPLFADLQPIRRAGEPEDIANAALWLASSESSFVTGHALAVDGGAACGVGWDPGQSRVSRLAAALAGDPP